MKKFSLNNQGFGSILEVTITAIVFSIATVGLISTITMLSPEATTASKRLEAVYIGKSIMDELRANVDASTWFLGNSDDPLETDVNQTRTVTRNGVDFNVTYNLVDDGSNGRKMTMTIQYPDS